MCVFTLIALAEAPLTSQIGFYKTFARPVAKVLLMATFAYQLSYWAWVKLEKDEIRSERQGYSHSRSYAA
jgi:hypothetical protein